MNRVDRWWNREFPAHSFRRLIFFWVAVPIVTLAVAGVRGLAGQSFSSAGYWTTALGSWVVITIAWWVATDRDDLPRVEDTLPDPMVTAGLPRWEVPVDLDPDGDIPAALHGSDDTSQVALPIVGSDTAKSRPDGWLSAELSRRETTRPSLLTDGLVTFTIMWITMTVVMWRLSPAESGFGAMEALMAMGGAALLTATMVFRHSLFILLIVSSILGLGGAILLRIFFIFLSDDDGLLWYWVMATLGIFAFVLPIYAPRRSNKHRHGGRRLPGWTLALPTGVIMVTSVMFMQPSAPPEPASSEISGDVAPMTTPSLSPSSTSRSAERLVQTLIQVSYTGGETEALRLAAPPVVALFSDLARGAIHLDACQEPAPTLGTCSLSTGQGPLLLSVTKAQDGRYFVSSARLLAPLASASPTP